MANSLYNAALHLGHQEDHHYQYQHQYQHQYRHQYQHQYRHQYQHQYRHQLQLQPEQQQMHQLLTTGTGDYYNNKKAAHIKLASTMVVTSPSSPPILANPPILNVPGDNYVESTNSAGTHVNFIVTATAGLPLSVPPNSDTVDMDTQRQQQQL
jgi:hypothetical protein